MPEEDDFLDDFDEAGFEETDFADDEYDETAASGDTVGDEDLGYLDDEFDDSYVDEEGWDAEEDELSAPIEGAGAQKERRKGGLQLSFNAMVITGAVIVGLCVLVWQVVSKKPQALESFVTALNMTGATDGPVFGQQEGENQNGVPAPQQEAAEGFLNDPKSLDRKAEVEGAPPMPSAIVPAQEMSPEEQAGLPEPADPVLTPMPEPTQMAEGAPVPRAPEETPPPPTYTIDAHNDEAPAPPAEPATPADAEQTPNKAADMLKDVMAAREQKKSEDAFGEEPEPPLAPAEEAPAPAVPAPEPEKEVASAPVVTVPPQAPAPVEPEMEKAPEIIPAEPMPAQEVVKAEPLPEPAVPASQAAVPAASPALEQKIDTLLEKLARMESRIEEIDAAQDTDIAAIRNELKGEISALKDGTAPARETPKAAAPAEPAPEQQAAAAPRPAPAKKAAAPKPADMGGAWVLKAAKPGKAWVSRAGNPNIQGVVVGDTLPGIGRVTAISFNGGRWVVQGTSGRINQ